MSFSIVLYFTERLCGCRDPDKSTTQKKVEKKEGDMFVRHTEEQTQFFHKFQRHLWANMPQSCEKSIFTELSHAQVLSGLRSGSNSVLALCSLLLRPAETQSVSIMFSLGKSNFYAPFFVKNSFCQCVQKTLHLLAARLSAGGKMTV